ncbi:hypothetical protein SteCoe_16803 [Stentor coeruleus]|uniref:DUF4200 domain-containing protein n=1 Tax=Stentor coeruleus TaxID=5963 RepID=A0A1R2C0H5_9CILI|nr:hypothetical protein SteCoe_16803 [Stentor coeruleus]
MSSSRPRTHTSRSIKDIHSSISMYKNSVNLSENRRTCMSHMKNRDKFLLDDDNPDASAVEALEFWNYKFDSDVQRQLIEAKVELKFKLENQGIVEENLSKRKKYIKKSAEVNQSREISRCYKVYEDTLMNTFKDLKCKIQECIKNREVLRKKTSEINDEIQKQVLLIEKYSNDYNDILKRSSSTGRLPRRSKDIVSYTLSKQAYKEKMMKQKIEAQKQIGILQNEIISIGKSINEYDTISSNYRNEIKIVKKELIEHYSDMLKQGYDSKSEGLSWIVKIFLNLKQKVRKDMFPTCLDDKSIEVIVEIAKKSIVLDENYNKLAETKDPRFMIFVGKPSIQTRLGWIKQNVRVRRPEYVKKKVKWAPEEALDSIDEVGFTHGQIHDSMKLEEKIKSSHDEILNLQTNEIKRLTKKCLKTGTNIKTLISYIVGSDNVDKFMVVSMKKVKEINQVHEFTSTFSFMSKHLKKKLHSQIFKSMT